MAQHVDDNLQYISIKKESLDQHENLNHIVITIRKRYAVIDNIHHIDIIDNGIGIDDIYSKQAFTLFSRLHNRSEYQGSGIGLSIVNKIINHLSGNVSIQKDENGGTRVSLEIPTL